MNGKCLVELLCVLQTPQVQPSTNTEGQMYTDHRVRSPEATWQQAKKPWKEGVQAQWFMPIIPATWEVEIERITVWGQPGQKVRKAPFQSIGWVVEHTCGPSCTGGLSRRTVVQTSLGKKM
jgi:hypothetical protein